MIQIQCQNIMDKIITQIEQTATTNKQFAINKMLNDSIDSAKSMFTEQQNYLDAKITGKSTELKSYYVLRWHSHTYHRKCTTKNA